MEPLIRYLSVFHPLSETLQNRIQDYSQEAFYEKGTILLSQGQTCTQLYFMLKGFARGVSLEHEKQITTWFWKEGDIVTSMHSFIKQEPTQEGIEALEDCHVYQLSYPHLQALYQEFIEFNIVGRKIIEQYFLKTGEITYALRNKTALEKYQYLLQIHPEIFERTTLLNIASYLGISKETISRIRKLR